MVNDLSKFMNNIVTESVVTGLVGVVDFQSLSKKFDGQNAGR